MKRILAISDTHMERWTPIPKLEELMERADLIVHCGDFHAHEVYEHLKSRYDLKAVRGNSDDERIKSELPEVTTFEVESVRFGLIHRGNLLNNFDDLGYEAREIGVDVLIFGHIHRYHVEKLGRVLLVSPGSPTQPKLSIATCAVLEVEKGRISVKMEIVQDLYCGLEEMKKLRAVK